MRWWRSLPAIERVPLALAAVAIFLGVTARAVAMIVSPRFALLVSCPAPDLAPARAIDPAPIGIERDVVHDELLDAWGRPWRFERDPRIDRITLYSVGPDGRDDRGGGDDVRITRSVMLEVVAIAPWLGAGVALLLLWASFVIGAVRAPRARAVWLEGWRALVIASPATVIVGACLLSVLAPALDRGLHSPWLLVRPSTAAVGAVALLLWLGALAARLRRPAPEEGPPVAWRRPAASSRWWGSPSSPSPAAGRWANARRCSDGGCSRVPAWAWSRRSRSWPPATTPSCARSCVDARRSRTRGASTTSRPMRSHAWAAWTPSRS
jgi:hypothetical protein